MPVSKSIREQLLNSFRAELSDHVQVMNAGLLAMEQNNPSSQEQEVILNDIFRAAHSLKGSARAVGATSIEQLAHKLESVLDSLRKETHVASPDFYSACYQALDAIQVVLKAYEAGEISPPVEALKALMALETLQPGKEGAQMENSVLAAQTPPDNPSPAVANMSDQNSAGAIVASDTIRVDVNKLDSLMTHLSELQVTKTKAVERLVHAQDLQELMTLWQRDWYSVRSAFSRALHQDLSGALRRLGPVEKGNGSNHDGRVMGKDILRLLDYLETSQKRLSEATTRINEIVHDFGGDTTHLSQVIDELGEEIKRVNMLPLNTITGSFGRMVRDLAQSAGKQAVLQIIGGETEIDKRVLEQIKDPLIHLLRNALDHGIELPDERQARGKPCQGTITLTAEQFGKDVVICISDDGAGLDIEGIRQSIHRQDQANVETLNESELAEAIFRLGVSTSRIITDISGRGVGLDVVRRNVEMLNGSVNVEWVSGKGSSFKMTLPLRLTSSRGLLVVASNQIFAVPINAIDRVISVEPKEVISLEGRAAIHYNGRPITLVGLSDVLNLETSAHNDGTPSPAIVLINAERCIAFAVDEILGEVEVVVKGLGKQLVRVNCIAGCTIMGSGEIVLILNPNELIKQAARAGLSSALLIVSPAAVMESEKKRRILVVDDSITTRTLEKHILEAAGYTVDVAINGQEAMNMVKTNGNPDLMVVDIIMPLMNGFELTQRVKNDPHMSHIPVILVTSLDSPEDKARGIDVGAEAYIVKSNFKQNNLLETIAQLI